MKKAGYCLIALTILFCGCIVSFLLGRYYNGGEVQLSGQLSPATAETDSTTTAHKTPGVTSGKVNINTATAEELTALPGIGSVLAHRIVIYRKENGPFKSADDLLKVAGIGEKKLESIRQYIVIIGN